MMENETRVKLILLGDSGVGKTAIIRRYHEDKFTPNNNTTDKANFFEKEVMINDQKIILELWDTVGQEEHRSLTKIFIKNSKIIILVYNVTSLESFNSLNFWYEFIIKEIGTGFVLGLAGNKTDLIFENDYEEEVSPEQGKEFALFNDLLIKYLNIRDSDLISSSTIKLSEDSLDSDFSMSKNECCIGKNKKSVNINMIFIGCNGVGKTTIIKTLKGNNNIFNLPHTKKNYKEKMQYSKNGRIITVSLKDTNGDEYTDQDLDSDIQKNKVFFFVFDINKIVTLYAMEKFIKKIDKKKNKVYLLGYNNNLNALSRNESECINEVAIFAKKYECEYEYLTIEDIYKLKALIIDNIGKHLETLGRF